MAGSRLNAAACIGRTPWGTRGRRIGDPLQQQRRHVGVGVHAQGRNQRRPAVGSLGLNVRAPVQQKGGNRRFRIERSRQVQELATVADLVADSG